MAVSKLYRLGRDLQLISDSVTWAEYIRQHPSAKVGFVHQGDDLLLTITETRGYTRGVVKCASNARQLLELAHLALCEEEEIHVH
jgi:hypothetical protein